MEVRSGYKQTEAGVIPEDWLTVAAEDIVDPDAPIRYGVVQVGRYVDSGVPIVAIKHVKEIRSAPLHRAPRDLEGPYARSRVKSGDVLISIKGTIGRVGIVPDGFTGNISRELARLRPRQELCGEYVAHQLEGEVTQARISRAVVGTTRLEFSIATLRQFALPFPPSSVEQCAIAAALSDVDALLGGLDRLIAKKRDLKRAAMNQLLTRQTRLPGFGGDWITVSLNGIVTKTAGFWGLGKPDPVHQKQVEVIRAGDVSPHGTLTTTVTRYFSDSEFTKAQCKLGDVVITGSGSVGKVWWCDGVGDVAASNFVRVLRPSSDRVDGRFLYFVLLSDATQRLMLEHTATGVMANLGSSFFATDWLRLPPVSEQRAIVAVLADMDADLAALEARREKTRALKRAMMQELLTGRTRLIPAGGADA